MMDLYGHVLSKALFPAFEAMRSRPTMPLLRHLHKTERLAPSELRTLQTGKLRRLLRHVHQHTPYYAWVLDQLKLHPDGVTSLDDLQRLPLLDRPTLRATMSARTTTAPPYAVIRKTTSGSSGQPVEVLYNAESRHWRDATRWRGYGWGGYQIGMRALHYWGFVPGAATPWHRAKIVADRWLKRDLYVDCTPRGEEALADVVATIRRFAPQVVVAYASGAGSLARFVNEHGLRTWKSIPVLTGAEGLLPHDRAAIERAFGPVFETYGCREVMLIGSECEAHDGLHTSMENLIVELIIREHGTARHARPGETGEVVITDLNNLACPMIRYVNGDLAVARDDEERCTCGRGLVRIGPILGRVTETMYDGHGREVGGLVFNVLFSSIGHVARSFQVVQQPDRSVVFRVVPFSGRSLPDKEEALLRAHAERYLPGAPFTIEIVDDIPLTQAGKRNLIVQQRAGE